MSAVFVCLAQAPLSPSCRVSAVEGVDALLRTLLKDATPIVWPHAGSHSPPQHEWVHHDFAEGAPAEGGGWGVRLRVRRAPLEAWLEPIARAEQAAALATTRRSLLDRATEAAIRLAGEDLAHVDAGVRTRAIAQWADEIETRILGELRERLSAYVAHGAVPSLYPGRRRSGFSLFPR